MALDGRSQRQIFQTVTCRLERGVNGPPDSYNEEEKKWSSVKISDRIK